jgi:hypothetical protein
MMFGWLVTFRRQFWHLGESRAEVDYIQVRFKLKFPEFFLSILTSIHFPDLRGLVRFIAIRNRFHKNMRS